VTHQFGGTEKLESSSLCAVYDPVTGDIHHWHQVVTVAGGCHPSREQIVSDALRAVAGRRQPVKGELRVLHVDPGTDTNRSHRVDHEHQRLSTESQAPPDLKT
jgi:hypothetical protein